MGDYEPDVEWIRFEKCVFGADGKQSWVVGHQGLTAHEGVSVVFALDWRRHTARLLPLNVEELSIAPYRKLLVGSGGRMLTRFKDIDLWTSPLSVANLKTGTWRYIVKGRVYVGNVALRP